MEDISHQEYAPKPATIEDEAMIRPYTASDEGALLNILRLNTPHFFAEAEAPDFIEYLHHLRESYFVMEVDGEIVGSGGINYFPAQNTARLSWDIIHPDFQGKGYGKELTLFRIEKIRRNPAIRTIVVRTSQLVYPFYEKAGFELEITIKDYWAEGIDLYQMRMELPD